MTVAVMRVKSLVGPGQLNTTLSAVLDGKPSVLGTAGGLTLGAVHGVVASDDCSRMVW